jgi:hypothetical protein
MVCARALIKRNCICWYTERMTRESIVDNKFILYADQIGMIKDALEYHRRTIANVMESFEKKGDIGNKNIWENFVQGLDEIIVLFTTLNRMVDEDKIDVLRYHLLAPEDRDD